MDSDYPRRENGLILISESTALGLDGRELRGRSRPDQLIRVRRGAYAPPVAPGRTADDTRYDLRIAAVIGTRRSSAVLSTYSAARVWGLPIINPWPWEVDISVPPASGRRSKNGVTVHRQHLAPAELTCHDSYLLTSPVRTLIDLARVAPFRDAVAALDAGLATGLVSRAELETAVESCGLMPGCRRALRAIQFASPLAKLPGESFSRVLMHEQGFPAPELQHEFSRPLGRQRFADFWWKHLRLIGEFDGQAKYDDPRYTAGLTPAQVVWEEKLRENELREHDVNLTRWVWADLVAVDPFVRRLEAAGLTRARAPFRRAADPR